MDARPRQGSGSQIGPAGWVALLLGAPIGILTAVFARGFQEVFGVEGQADDGLSGVVVGVVLCTLAIGVRVPRRFAFWICVVAWRRLVPRGPAPHLSGVLLSSGGVDRPLYWVVLSVIALTAGVLTALLPCNIFLARAAYDWMYAHFLWSTASLVTLQASIVFAAGVVPLTFLGLAVSCVHHVACPYGRWEPKTTAWLMGGAATGVLIASLNDWMNVRWDLMLVAGALPALVAALVCSLSSTARAGPDRALAGSEPPPAWSDRWPMLLRSSIVAVAGGGAAVITLWAHHLGETGAHVGVFVAASLAALGVGFLAGCRVRRAAQRSIGGFGVTCASAGVIVAASTLALSDSSSGVFCFASAAAYSSLAAIGFATAYGWQALLNRVGSRSFAGATMLTQTLVCTGLTVWIGAPVAERLIGRQATMVTVALSLLALSGTLIIHEPRYSPRTRRARLCTVFGSIAAMIMLTWLTPRWWQRRGTLGRDATNAGRAAEPRHIAAKLDNDVGQVANLPRR